MFERAVRWLCAGALRRPWLPLAVAAALCVPAAVEANKIRLDTNLERLLPEDSPAVRRSRELANVVGGDGGYFTVLFEGEDRARLVAALDATAARVAALPEVQSVESRNPVDFLRRHKYLLAPSTRLQQLLDRVLRLEREVNPFVESLEDEEPDEAQARHDDADLERTVRRYLDLPELHQSEDGRIVGMIVRPRRGITALGATRDLYERLSAIAAEQATARGLWSGVAGSLRTKVDIYAQIRSDLNRSGVVSTVGILITLVLAFRGLRALPIVLLPLAVGLLWSYGLVPTLVGDLNTITSFLLMVLFGMGVEFSIHLVKRFQHELGHGSPDAALVTTFLSTGRSILTSGFATTLGMAVLLVSDFRGFSEFGVISATSILAIFLAMFVVLPPALVLGARCGMVRAHELHEAGSALMPPRWGTVVVLAIVIAAAVAGSRLSFDYDFQSLQADTPATAFVKEKHRAVFAGFSAPAAVYAAADFRALDGALAVLDAARERERGAGTVTLGSVLSVRDVVPDAAELARRRELLAEIQDRLRAAWTRRVKDAEQRRWIADIVAFVPPDAPPTVDQLPPELRRRFATRDDSGGWILSVDTAGRSRDGLMAMAFTRGLYDLTMPPGVRGPTGDKPVLAEILWIVTREGPWLVGLTFVGIAVLVLLDRRNLGETFWVELPLVGGLLLTLGGMVLCGWKLNFFNIVVLPNLIGNAVDNGVHYFRRFKETGHDTAAVQAELAGALTASAGTTVMGYLGMVFAHHAGLRSIGSVAVLGLFCCWFTGIVLMPGVLDWLARRGRGAAEASA